MSRKKIIFIIEYERIIGLDLKNHIEKLGNIICEQYNLIDAKTLEQQKILDLIIADTSIQQQPDFKAIKDFLVKSQLPVVCIGTSIDEQTTKDCQSINIIGTFSKPFNTDKIIKLIDQYFNN